MIHHLLFVAGAESQPAIEAAVLRFGGQKREKNTKGSFLQMELSHRLLGKAKLDLSFVSSCEAVAPFLKENPVDLLVYDERSPDFEPAAKAVEIIRAQVRALADQWGPDFLFPTSRIAVILRSGKKSEEQAFELGRFAILDVITDPENFATLVLWIRGLLAQSMSTRKKIGMALSGGGVEGFLYQLGVLFALEKALEGKGLRKAAVVAGMSSGSIAGSMFAAGVPTIEVVRALHHKSSILAPLTSSTIFDVAGMDIGQRLIKQSLLAVSLKPLKWLNQTASIFPTGFLRGDRLEQYFKKALALAGHGDHFSDFDCKVFIGATDQDSFEHVVFGLPPWESVRVSEAVRASAALPPVFLPKKISGRWFIDGQVTKTTDVALVVEQGCSLVVIINPLKPFINRVPGSTDKLGGIFGLIQTVKALISSRFQASLEHITERYPGVDFVVFEPDEECAQMMSGSPMKLRLRTKIVESAFYGTLRKIRERHHVYGVKFKKYGLTLKDLSDIEATEAIDFEELVGSSLKQI